MSVLGETISIFKKKGIFALAEEFFSYMNRGILMDIGILGIFKSIYYSLIYTGNWSSIVIHSNTVTEMSRSASLEVNGRFLVGLSRGTNYVRATKSHLSVGENGSIRHTGDTVAKIGPNSKLSIDGDFCMGDSFITSNAYIACEERIEIGDGVAIGPKITMMDADYHQITINGQSYQTSQPIVIEDNVWIGMDVAVKKGVTVGEGSVIASHSVVTSDVPPGVLVAGCPAEVVRENVTWE